MAGQNIQSLPQGVELFLVVGNDDGVDDVVGSGVAVGAKLNVEIAGFAARGRGGSRRGEGLGAGERGGGAAAAVRKLEVLQRLVVGNLANAPGDVPKRPIDAA